MTTEEKLQLAIEAGHIMLANGAETYRVEDTIQRILSAFSLQMADNFVTATGIFASVQDENGIVTLVRRVPRISINLERVARVNDLSRNIVNGTVAPEDAMTELKRIAGLPPIRDWLRVLASGASCFSFAYMFGGSLMDSVNAGLTGLILYLILVFLQNRYVTGLLTPLIGGVLIGTFSSLLFTAGVGDSIDKIITGAIMPLVPGVGLTVAIRDILDGNYLSGTSRILDAVIVAVLIATGVGVVLKLWMVLGGLV